MKRAPGEEAAGGCVVMAAMQAQLHMHEAHPEPQYVVLPRGTGLARSRYITLSIDYI